MPSKKLIVQKFGGATVESAEKIKSIASKIAEKHKSGEQVVAVVSAMGSSTNQLIQLAHQVSPQPPVRELDMLLSTGERVSMALMTMALHDQGVPAISFTGSQAGVLTDDRHLNAFIQDVKPVRLLEALHQGKVVVLAGFQGVSPVTKEITTLGRGGTDTTAVAIAGALKAQACEILKEVPAVFSGDPRLIPNAKPLNHLTYSQLMDMTFWGAKVLHYRSVELAAQLKVPLYVGPAHNLDEGTWVKEVSMYEQSRILSVNSHERVLWLEIQTSEPASALEIFEDYVQKNEIAYPQILFIQNAQGKTHFLVTAPKEVLDQITNTVQQQNQIQLRPGNLATVTATCSSVTSAQGLQRSLAKLKSINVKPEESFLSPLSLSFVVPRESRDQALKAIHDLIEE